MHVRRSFEWPVLVASLLLGLAGCDSDPLTGPDAVQGVVWKLQSLMRNGAGTVTMSQPERYTLEFLGTTLAVKADCNTCTGPYTLNGSSIQIGALACTRAACPADSRDQEYLAILSGAQTYGVDDDVLTIHSTEGQLTFKP
jgi:heat shock protein HslJ